MQKIVYVVSTLKRSGPINVLFNIVKHMSKNKFQIFVITLSKETEDTLLPVFKELKVDVIQLNINRINILNILLTLKKKLDEISPSVVHTHGIRADAFVGMIKKQFLHISTLHNHPFLDYQYAYGCIIGWLAAKLHVAIVKKIALPVGCSKSIQTNYQGWVGEHVKGIPNGIDLNDFKPINSDQKKILKKKLGFDEEKKICIVVGNLMKRKNPFEIINSFKRLNLEADLVFVGEGVLMAECIELAKGHDNIKILGNKKNVTEYLQISDCFVSASIAEGLPNAVIEAMAVGLPIILSNIPAHCELFSEDYAGFFNLGELNDAFQIILSKFIDNYDQISRQMIAESIKFSAKKMSFEYQRLYQSVGG